jgi:hypothetical protein
LGARKRVLAPPLGVPGSAFGRIANPHRRIALVSVAAAPGQPVYIAPASPSSSAVSRFPIGLLFG